MQAHPRWQKASAVHVGTQGSRASAQPPPSVPPPSAPQLPPASPTSQFPVSNCHYQLMGVDAQDDVSFLLVDHSRCAYWRLSLIHWDRTPFRSLSLCFLNIGESSIHIDVYIHTYVYPYFIPSQRMRINNNHKQELTYQSLLCAIDCLNILYENH